MNYYMDKLITEAAVLKFKRLKDKENETIHNNANTRSELSFPKWLYDR